MAADLRCDEVLEIRPEEHPQENNSILAQFCVAYKDRAIMQDARVFRNMLELEEFYLPTVNLYENVQDEIKIHMRKIVTEWMLDVCLDQRCHVDVFLLATNIMDRFLGAIKLQKKQFQLLGAASIFLASKMIEPQPISALALVNATANTYDREELLSMELLILSKLKWDLTAITSYDYLDHLLNALLTRQRPSGQSNDGDRMETKVRRNTEKLVTLCATDETFMSMPPSLVAASALVTAIQQDEDFDLNLNQIIASVREMTKLDVAALRDCMHSIERIFLQHANEVDWTHHGNAQNWQQNVSRSYTSDPNSESNEQNTTPTEVFSVLALCVT